MWQTIERVQPAYLSREEFIARESGDLVERAASNAPGGRVATVGFTAVGGAAAASLALMADAPWWAALLIAGAGAGLGYALGSVVDEPPR